MYLKNSEVTTIKELFNQSGYICKGEIIEHINKAALKKKPIKDLFVFLEDEGDGEVDWYQPEDLVYFYREFSDSEFVYYLCFGEFDRLVLSDIFEEMSEHVEFYKDYVVSADRLPHVLSLGTCPMRYLEDIKIKSIKSNYYAPDIDLVDPKADRVFKELEFSRFVKPMVGIRHNDTKNKDIPAKLSFREESNAFFVSFNNTKNEAIGNILERTNSSGMKEVMKSVAKGAPMEVASHFIPGAGLAQRAYEKNNEIASDRDFLDKILKIISGSKDSLSVQSKAIELVRSNPETKKYLLNEIAGDILVEQIYGICVEKKQQYWRDRRDVYRDKER